MKTITIGGKEIPMLRNALSPIIYRRIFHKDSIAQMSKISSEDMGGDVVDLYTEIAFVMSVQATKQPEELKKVCLIVCPKSMPPCRFMTMEIC